MHHPQRVLRRMGLSLISASSPDPNWDFPAFIGSRLIKARSLRVHSRARRTFEAPPIKMDASKMAAGSSCSGACVVLSMCWVVRVMGCVYPCCRGLCISLSLSVTRPVPCLSVSLSLCFNVSLTVFVARLCLCPCLCLPAHVPVPAPAPAPVPSIPLPISLTLSSLVANCSQPNAGSPFLQLIE